MQNTWTDERVEQLTKLYAEGYSCSVIAEILGNATRNSIIGKVHRLGLESPPGKKCDASRSERKAKRAARVNRPTVTHSHSLANVFRSIGGHFTAPRPIETIIGKPYTVRCVEVERLNLTTEEIDLRTQCQWIEGEDHLHCGLPVKFGFSYCPEHADICYRPRVEKNSPEMEAA